MPRLPEVRVPTLFVTGVRDSHYPLELARAHAAAVPGARFEVVEGTSHLSIFEAPERALRLVREFLSAPR